MTDQSVTEFRACGDYAYEVRPMDPHPHIGAAQADAESMTDADSVWIEERKVGSEWEHVHDA